MAGGGWDLGMLVSLDKCCIPIVCRIMMNLRVLSLGFAPPGKPRGCVPAIRKSRPRSHYLRQALLHPPQYLLFAITR